MMESSAVLFITEDVQPTSADDTHVETYLRSLQASRDAALFFITGPVSKFSTFPLCFIYSTTLTCLARFHAFYNRNAFFMVQGLS